MPSRHPGAPEDAAPRGPQDEREAAEEVARGELELLQAEMGYRLALLELQRVVGRVDPWTR